MARKNVNHKDDFAHEDFASASHIRKLAYRGEDVSNFIPDYELITENKLENYFEIFKYKMISEKINFSHYFDYEVGLENRILDNLDSKNFEELIEKVHSKRHSRSRIKRLILEILLDIKKDAIKKSFEVAYTRVLACDERGIEILKKSKSKNVKDARVGDTITLKNNRTSEAMPGYKKVVPMVFCGVYPGEGEEYNNVREALEKLQVNDAALDFEAETSVALGFGFRCGFLGLLHMEIIQERLEREFDLNIVTTAPSVIYHVMKKDGEMISIQNPSNLPDPTEIDYMEEPIVKAEIMTPTDYVGQVMELCQNRRGIFKDMQYLEETRALITYHMPLNEVIYDFFDALKSKTRGYASYDYELIGYEKSDLVKLDILINEELVDAFSLIVHESNSYIRARKICEKLKDVIPRHQFAVPIQAAIGNKIIARETIRALRKDVLAKCYGGDITRKRKLLEKQKEGKKRMRTVGSVDIPQDAFLSVLKYDEEK